jgi:hypothetical protein
MRAHAAAIIVLAAQGLYAAGLEISSGETVLSAGTYTYDYVSITGGQLKIAGNVTIICNGTGTAYFNFASGLIYAESLVPAYDFPNCGNGITGADGNDLQGGHSTCDGKTGGAGPICKPKDANDGYSFKVYANGDITVKGTINIPGNPGYNNGSMGGAGGTGGMGGDVRQSQSMIYGGYGGIGGRGADNYGGKGGKGGTVRFETHGGKVDCGNASVHASINLTGGVGGTGGTGGTGGSGGGGGNLVQWVYSLGAPGTGGNGARGGDSVGGTGGQGGSLTLVALQVIDTYLAKDISGGAAGTYGLPGSGGSGGLGGLYPGSMGQRAANGSAGTAGTVRAGTAGAQGTFSKTTIVEPANCQQAINAGFRVASDANGDCVVNFKDVTTLAAGWVRCNDPQVTGCEKNWRYLF